MGLSPQQLLSGFGAGASIGGGLAQGQAARDAAQAQSQAALYNAKLAEQEAQSRADYVRRAGHRELTSDFVQMSAGGVRVQGTPLDVLSQRAYEIEREATNAQIEGRNTARLDRAQAQGITRAGKVSARNALIGGIGQAARFGPSLWGV